MADHLTLVLVDDRRVVDFHVVNVEPVAVTFAFCRATESDGGGRGGIGGEVDFLLYPDVLLRAVGPAQHAGVPRAAVINVQVEMFVIFQGVSVAFEAQHRAGESAQVGRSLYGDVVVAQAQLPIAGVRVYITVWSDDL